MVAAIENETGRYDVNTRRHERSRAFVAGNGLPARLLKRTLRQVGATVEVGRCATPPEASVNGYPDVVFATPDIGVDAVECVSTWSRVDGIAVIAFQNADVAERLELFDAGADDVWPVDISPEEAGARLRAVLRRVGRDRRLELTDGERVVSITRNDLMVDGASIRMTRIRHHLLFVLAENHPHTTGHDELIEKVWGYQVVGDEPGFVQTQVSRLRRELDRAGLPDLVRTARGVGYGLCGQFTRSPLGASGSSLGS
ncbi:MAG: response regulator transcription factor [Dehalococcoidia bacterium]|nr:response regulator transcription factor [Dehalococcoidia bacterium]MCA9850132.1 response regulator transcription factor [Dehalococcoidia bacterium]MCA9856593.1 response regulator transcription factor [Dehalococcoidia bacterium]